MQFVAFFLSCLAGTFGVYALLSGGKPLLYLRTGDPLELIAAAACVFALVSFLAGLIADEYSWVDRLWSVAPVLYAWIVASREFPNARLILAASLITLWGVRLTFNFARKGGYSGVEDYRWQVVRRRIGNEFLWQAFNLGFISAYQNGLFVLFVAPLYQAYIAVKVPFGGPDYAAAGLFATFLVIETVADRQQWEFQQFKHASKQAGAKPEGRDDDVARGFLTHGLFAYSRHPNYFGEIGIWWAVYLFGAAATGQWVHWSVLGAVLLTLLFQGSTALTEKLSMEKYPDYARYRRQTSKIVPWFKNIDTRET